MGNQNSPTPPPGYRQSEGSDAFFQHYEPSTALDVTNVGVDLRAYISLQWRDVDGKKRARNNQKKILRQVPILEVPGKLFWLRHMNPVSDILSPEKPWISVYTRLIEHDPANGEAVVEAVVLRNAKYSVIAGVSHLSGDLLASNIAAFRRDQAQNLDGKYVQKAVTDAIGRALSTLGLSLPREPFGDIAESADGDSEANDAPRQEQRVVPPIEGAPRELQARVWTIAESLGMVWLAEAGRAQNCVVVDGRTADLIWFDEDAKKIAFARLQAPGRFIAKLEGSGPWYGLEVRTAKKSHLLTAEALYKAMERQMKEEADAEE